jgi:hypothetical protein
MEAFYRNVSTPSPNKNCCIFSKLAPFLNKFFHIHKLNFEKYKIRQRKWDLLADISGWTAKLFTFITWGSCLTWPAISTPKPELYRHSKCKSPWESKIRNIFWDKAWMEIAFTDLDIFDMDLVSTSFPFNAKKHAPPSLLPCLDLTFVCFTECKNT